jgi:hypothetical protein
MTRLLPLLLIAAIACSAASASAQTMYRCGNAYQDHPCSGGQAGKVFGAGAGVGSEATRTLPASSRPSAQCSQRGIAAQKIKWIREAGKTQQEQAAAANGGAERDLIADVYGRQGTSVEVRSAVEADCMAEQERAAQIAALLEAANGRKGGSTSPGSRIDAIANESSATSTPAAATPPGADNAGKDDATSKQATCQRLTRQLEDVRSRQRTGNNASGMEQLRQQYRDINDLLRAAGC